MFDKITEQSFLRVTMNNYDNIQCTTIEEFNADLKRFNYLKRLFNRYMVRGILKERLILNHIIILHNVFGIITPELLFFKIPTHLWPVLATFLVYLDIMPDEIPEFHVKLKNIELDTHIISILRNL